MLKRLRMGLTLAELIILSPIHQMAENLQAEYTEQFPGQPNPFEKWVTGLYTELENARAEVVIHVHDIWG